MGWDAGMGSCDGTPAERDDGVQVLCNLGSGGSSGVTFLSSTPPPSAAAAGASQHVAPSAAPDQHGAAVLWILQGLLTLCRPWTLSARSRVGGE